MGEVALHTFAQVVLRNMDSVMVDEIKLPKQLQDEIQKLSSCLKSTIAVLDDAERRQITSEAVKAWLHRLQDVVYDLDDVVDEISIELALRRRKNRGHLQREVSFFFSYLNPQSKYSQLTNKIKAIRHRLDLVARYMSNFRFVESVGFTRESRETSSSYSGNEILGREEDKEEILSLICGIAKDEEPSVVSIVGMSGIGKTTLAKLIFNDSSIQNSFDIKLWVNARSFDIKNILKQMIAYATGKSSKLTYLEMRDIIYEKLRNKRIFLVLDDCWDEHRETWRRLREVITGGYRGSTIVVTTRFLSVAFACEARHIHELGALRDDTSFRLFMLFAFGHIDGQNSRKFEYIASEIVRHCEGIPLMLKVLGRTLNGKMDVAEWEQILDRFRGLSWGELFEVLALGYENFPSYLKLPFHTFNLRGRYETNVDEFICLWMALGFLHSDEPTQQQEYIGRKYLTEFAKSSLFDDVVYALGGVVSDINMHDLVCDLAVVKAAEQWVMTNSGTYEITGERARYIVCDEDDLRGREFPKKLLTARKSRAFMLYTREQTPAMFLRIIVSEFKCLRVLGLGGCDIEMLPDSIGQLKHLRYLDVGRNPRMKRLPDSICDLLNLQTLFLHGCDQLEEMPENIGRLETLRYLTLTTLLESLPEGIGNLISLRTFGLDHCSRLAYLPSSMKNLKKLQTLGLVDCPALDLMSNSSVEGLKGIDGIETLLLVDLPNFLRLPSDLGIPAVSLKHLQIQNCSELTETTWIKQLVSLRSLAIENCPELLDIGDGSSQFKDLGELVIRGCQSLSNTTWIKQFILLYSLVIEDCPNLPSLGEAFFELKYLEWLEIKGCPQLSQGCARDAGEGWLHIADVPKIQLDGVNLF